MTAPVSVYFSAEISTISSDRVMLPGECHGVTSQAVGLLSSVVITLKEDPSAWLRISLHLQSAAQMQVCSRWRV